MLQSDGGSTLGSEKLAIGDRILSICSQDVRDLTLIDVAILMKLSSSIIMKVTRYKSKQTSMWLRLWKTDALNKQIWNFNMVITCFRWCDWKYHKSDCIVAIIWCSEMLEVSDWKSIWDAVMWTINLHHLRCFSQVISIEVPHELLQVTWNFEITKGKQISSFNLVWNIYKLYNMVSFWHHGNTVIQGWYSVWY